MSFTNFQKTIALTSGVLVLSVAVALVVIAWTGPSADPPLNNAPEPLNVGNIDQTKTGALTVKTLFLDDGASKGDIYGAEDIVGANDLFLYSAQAAASSIMLDEDSNQGIKFYTNSNEVMVVGDDGNVYISNLNNCDTIDTDATGKLVCGTDDGFSFHQHSFSWDPPTIISLGFVEKKFLFNEMFTPNDNLAVIGVIMPYPNVFPGWPEYTYQLTSGGGMGNEDGIRLILENRDFRNTLSVPSQVWTLLYVFN